jgi:O-antigen ligase
MHPPLFGQLEAMLILVYFFFLVRKTGLLKKALLVFSFGLSMIGLLLAYTRGPWLAAAIALISLGILRPNFRRILGIMAIIGVVVGMLGMYQLANSDFLQERIHTEGTFEGRLRFIANSLRVIADHPLFGVGHFRTRDVMWQYAEGVYIPFYGYVKKKMGEDIVPHDIYIGRTADEGLLSAGLLLAIGLVFLKSFINLWRANPQGPWFNRDFMAVIAGIMICYLVGGMVIDYRYFDIINVMVFLHMGIIYGWKLDPQQDTAGKLQ